MIKVFTASSSKISELEKSSALTWEGMSLGGESLLALETYLNDTFGLADQDKLIAYTWSGKTFNTKYNLHGSNAYPDDLNFISFDLSNFQRINMANCLDVKRYGGRWLDDIVSNNRRREELNMY